MPAQRVPLEERFWSKVEKRSDCWIWMGARTGNGYGAIGAGTPSRAMLLAHRVAYEWKYGPVRQGYELDHLCRQTVCVRPEHLAEVPHRENLRRSDLATGLRSRKTHCPKGHPYDEANTRHYAGRRHCRACAADAASAYKRRTLHPV